MPLVNNEFPKLSKQAYKLAIVGEAPGAQEEVLGRPFVGGSGQLLWQKASRWGIVRDACLVGNVCQVRPPGNQLSAFAWEGPEIQSGITQLNKDIAAFAPNLVLCLGASAYRWARGYAESIQKLRGTLFHSMQGPKAMGSIHPAAILREFSWLPMLNFDLKRAREEAAYPELVLPERNLCIDLTLEQIIARLRDIKQNCRTISIDIEGYVYSISCISIATSPYDAFVIPFDGWSASDEGLLRRELTSVLSDVLVPKILQNALYDMFCLQFGDSIPVRGVCDDTMLAHWELYCELPKNLGFQASIYTKEPYWKDERASEDRQTRLLYACKDAAVTFEIRDAIRKQLASPVRGLQLDHYKFNLGLLEPFLYMELNGINYDQTKANEKLQWCRNQIHRLQWALDKVAGIHHPTTASDWLGVCARAFDFKPKAHLATTTTKLLELANTTALHLVKEAIPILEKTSPLSVADVGQLAQLTETHLNVDSSKQIANYLYRTLGLPVQYKKEAGRRTEKETTDILALLDLYKKSQDPTLRLIIRLRGLLTRTENLSALCDPDGRIRTSLNVVGTETGRVSSSKSPTGSGFNLQTATKKDRDLFLPDPGYWLFQCDLEGADGWTVAAHSAALGDRTMLEDYQYGLKPARIIALLYQHGREVLVWSREKLKSEGAKIDKDGWLYFACKRVQHGSNYGMKAATMSDQILKDSYKLFGEAIYVDPAVCSTLQSLYFARYPGVIKWQLKVKNQLTTYGYIISANGHKRDFFGRKADHDTFKAALSEEPQNNTTWVTNCALDKCWSDPENSVDRVVDKGDGQTHSGVGQRRLVQLRIQPLHQVHDALVGQFQKTETDWACSKINQYFNNPITIAGIKLVIPYDGAYGESWGSLKEGKL